MTFLKLIVSSTEVFAPNFHELIVVAENFALDLAIEAEDCFVLRAGGWLKLPLKLDLMVL